MASTSQPTNISFNVHCIQCGNVFTPQERTSLWWRAKQRVDKGFLDALACTGEECGCENARHVHEPNAPYRVVGYSMDLIDFDVPFHTFTAAVKQIRHCIRKNLDIAFIQGVSPSVQRALELGR